MPAAGTAAVAASIPEPASAILESASTALDQPLCSVTSRRVPGVRALPEGCAASIHERRASGRAARTRLCHHPPGFLHRRASWLTGSADSVGLSP